MTKKIIIANWKMNNSFDEAEIWLQNFSQKIEVYKKDKSLPDLVVCPPAIIIDYLDELLMEEEFEKISSMQKNIEKMSEEEIENLASKLRNIHLGGQDCHAEISGAFTGDISAKMLKDAGCEYVIVGHCERRQYHFESDQIILAKIKAAANSKLIPILCIGESRELRVSNKYKNFLEEQLKAVIPDDLILKELIVAYEPIWSIGTGLTPSLEQIEEVMELIKNFLSKKSKISKSRILYGGSVKKENADQIIKGKNVDGFLVGSASVKADEFFEIVKAAN